MRNIYADVTFVVAWLEADSTEVKEMLSMINQACPILKTSSSGYKQGRINSQKRPQEENLLTEILRLDTSDTGLEQLIKTLCERLEVFFNQAWFKRVCTLQEEVLASNLILQAGWMHATWNDIFRICLVPESPEPNLGNTSAFQSTMFSMISLRLSVKRPGGRSTTLPWTGVIAWLTRVTSDSRDYVYRCKNH